MINGKKPAGPSVHAPITAESPITELIAYDGFLTTEEMVEA